MALALSGRRLLCWYMTWRVCSILCRVFMSACMPADAINTLSDLGGMCGMVCSCGAFMTYSLSMREPSRVRME